MMAIYQEPNNHHKQWKAIPQCNQVLDEELNYICPEPNANQFHWITPI